jgi:hypothetical protein
MNRIYIVLSVTNSLKAKYLRLRFLTLGLNGIGRRGLYALSLKAQANTLMLGRAKATRTVGVYNPFMWRGDLIILGASLAASRSQNCDTTQFQPKSGISLERSLLDL